MTQEIPLLLHFHISSLQQNFIHHTHRHRQLPLRGAQGLVDGAVDDFV